MKTNLEVTPCSSSGILDASTKESFSWIVKKDMCIATSLLSLKPKRNNCKAGAIGQASQANA